MLLRGLAHCCTSIVPLGPREIARRGGSPLPIILIHVGQCKGARQNPTLRGSAKRGLEKTVRARKGREGARRARISGQHVFRGP